MIDFVLKFLLVLQLLVFKRGHVSGLLLVLLGGLQGDQGPQGGHESDQVDHVESLDHGLVNVGELGVLNSVDDGQSLDSRSNVLDGADCFRRGGAGGQNGEGFVFSFVEKLSGVGCVHEGAALGFDPDFVLGGLLHGLVFQQVVVDGQSSFHAL